MSKIFTITAGHSNTDPGAVSGKRKESDIAVDMRNMVAYYLIEAGATVVTDGKAKDNKNLNEAIKLAKAKSNDIDIEFHCNAAASSTAKGVELLADKKHKALCQKIAKSIATTLNTTVRGEGGWKPENSGQHSKLGFVQAGGIICELFFITNPKELETWDAKKWLVAKDVARVLLEN